MIGSPATRKRNPVLNILLPLLTIVLILGACFAFCWILWWLNMNTTTPTPSF
ncbi:MAG TPA: hypothetical protein VF952_15995 [Chloroflexia bacterium]|jgi:hypothetical protein